MVGAASELEARVTVLESLVAQLQYEMQIHPRRRRDELPNEDVFDADELGLDPDEDEDD